MPITSPLRARLVGGLRALALASVSALALAAAARPASATLYQVDVYENTVGRAFDAVLGSRSLFDGGSHATFTYNGDLNFANRTAQNDTTRGDNTKLFFNGSAPNAANISNYKFISGPASPAPYGSFENLETFLSSSGSIAGYGYGSLYVFTYEGPTAGTVLTLTHDDGVGVYSGGVLLTGTTTGPTSEITESVVLPAGNGYQIVYGRENGSPSVLNVTVPEPASLAIFGAGLLGYGLVRRKRA